jgi:hypothetical protein
MTIVSLRRTRALPRALSRLGRLSGRIAAR